VTLDSLAGLQTFAFNQAGVSSVSWQNIAGDQGWGQFDNVNVGLITSFAPQTDDYDVSLAPITAPVPEPETYALMLAGLGMVAWVARRRRPQD
jgi:PEP-CTERM motif